MWRNNRILQSFYRHICESNGIQKQAKISRTKNSKDLFWFLLQKKQYCIFTKLLGWFNFIWIAPSDRRITFPKEISHLHIWLIFYEGLFNLLDTNWLCKMVCCIKWYSSFVRQCSFEIIRIIVDIWNQKPCCFFVWLFVHIAVRWQADQEMSGSEQYWQVYE